MGRVYDYVIFPQILYWTLFSSITQSPILPEVAVISPEIEASDAVIIPSALIENLGSVASGTNTVPPTIVLPSILPPTILVPESRPPASALPVINPLNTTSPDCDIKKFLECIEPPEDIVIPPSVNLSTSLVPLLLFQKISSTMDNELVSWKVVEI